MRTHPTPAEAVLWARLRKRQVAGFKFRRQHVIAGFIVDFYCPSLQLAVEVDGPIHRYRRRQDERRTRILENYGVKIIRFASEDILDDVEQVIRAIRSVLPERQSPCCLG